MPVHLAILHHCGLPPVRSQPTGHSYPGVAYSASFRHLLPLTLVSASGCKKGYSEDGQTLLLHGLVAGAGAGAGSADKRRWIPASFQDTTGRGGLTERSNEMEHPGGRAAAWTTFTAIQYRFM